MKYETATFDNDGRLAIEGDVRPNRRWWIIGIVAALLAIGGAYFGFKQSAKPTAVAAKKEELPNVSIVVPGSRIVPRVVSATGSLAARREMPVGVAGEGGMVTRVLVEPGQWVRSGQVLAQVDRSVQSQTAASLAAQINVARSDAAIAQSELKRAESLVDRGFISKADLERKAATRDAALARVNVAQASLGEQRARNGRLDIRAPAAGLILTRSVEPGQIVSSGSGTLFRMAKDGEMEMRAALSEADLAGLPVGVSASVTPVGASQSFKGEVWQVSPVIDPNTRQGIARIALAYNPGLRPGGFAAAQITSGGARAPQLPNSAIQSDAAGNYVYVLDAQDRVVRRQVTLGGVSDEGVMVASGLSGTERVVLSAGAFLSPGQKVKPILKNAQG